MSSSDPNSRESFPLVIERPNEDVSIEICDAFDRIVAAPLAMRGISSPHVQDTSHGGTITVELPRGLYLVRGALGGDTQEQVVRMSGAMTIDAPTPVRATSAAYQGVESSHEYYSYPAADFSQKPTTDALTKDHLADSWLYLFVRARDKDSYTASGGGLEQAAAQWHLETPQGNAIPLAAHSTIHSDGWLAFSASAPAGEYRLHDLGNEPRTTSVALYPRWQTQLFLTFDRRVLHGTLHASFARLDRGFLPHDDWARAVDLGLSVLAGGGGTLPSDARRILLGDKFENPMLGLIAVWVALRDYESSRELSGGVLANLDSLLPDSPDVAVLRMAHARRYGHPIPLRPIRRTPMLRVAVSELIRVAAEHPEILPDDSLIDDVSPRLYTDSAFTSWRPLDSELPASLRRARNTAPFVFLPDRNALSFQINVWNSDSEQVPFRIETGVQESKDSEGFVNTVYDNGTELETDTRERGHTSVDDPDAWLPDAVADVIEQQARHQCRESKASPLELPRLAKQTGVTPKAVRQILLSAPLEGIQVAMSLSDTPNTARAAGQTGDAINDVMVYLARTLIAAGASIAYGGDFRRGGYTEVLAAVIRTYNQTGTRAPQSLHSYLGAPIELKEAFEDLPLVVHHLVRSPDIAPDAMMPPPSPTEQHPSALYYSDMRRVMAKHTSARIVLGGQSEPRTQDKGPGYGGRYPGIVEEAWRTLEAGKPLYVAGGFGGAAELVADLLEGREIPALLQDGTFAASKYFQDKIAAIDNDRDGDGVPYRKKLGLPQRMEDLAQAVRDLGLPQLENDQASVAWNGLTVAENRIVFRTSDPLVLTSLVRKGLLAAARK
jgi:hypothetical protein